MKISKKLVFFVALMSLFYCVSLMQSTYAKYVTRADANANITIARWNILVNHHDVTLGTNFSDFITPVFAGTSYIKEGVIAPTSQGYFDIVISAASVDVSFDYKISVDLAYNNTIQDLRILNYEKIGISGTQPYDQATGLRGSINLTDTEQSATYRFYVEWDDNPDTQRMDNAQDTSESAIGVAAFRVNVQVIQSTAR